MIACCTDDLCDVYPCDINASSDDDGGSSSPSNSPPFFQLNSKTILTDSHMNGCTIGLMSFNVSYLTSHAIDRTMVLVGESNMWHRANNIPTHHSSSSAGDVIIRDDLECRDDDHAGTYSTVSCVTTTRAGWTACANSLTYLCANTSASTEAHDVVTVLAIAMAFFGVFLMTADQHFPVPICAILTLVYWASVLWIVSPIVGGTLIVLAGSWHGSLLLFPAKAGPAGTSLAFYSCAAVTCTLSPLSEVLLRALPNFLAVVLPPQQTPQNGPRSSVLI
jgi:hypothetical protein